MNLCNKWWRMCINCGEQVQTRTLSGQYGEYECDDCGCREFTRDYNKVGDPSCVPVEYGGEYERFCMSAQAENYTLDDFLEDDSVCASYGVDPDSPWEIPEDSPVGRCIGLDSDGEVCDECFHEHSTVYRAGGIQ